MSCNGSTTYGPLPVWSAKSTATWLFHPASAPESSTGIKFARPALEVAQSSGAIKVRPAVRYSNDMVTWDSASAIDAANMTQTNNGLKYGSFTDIETGAKLYLQWGVEVCNDSGTATEMALISLRIDRKG